MKVGDLVIHKNPKFQEHSGVKLVTFVGPTAFQFLGHSGFHPYCDWRAIDESR